jgi:transposase
MKSYKTWTPTQPYLLPPSPLEWLPEGHLVYFMLDVVEELDLSPIEDTYQAKDRRGTRPYAPHMMVALLLYGYCVGVYSSRKLEKATYEDVGFRVLSGGYHPDHTRISESRR